MFLASYTAKSQEEKNTTCSLRRKEEREGGRKGGRKEGRNQASKQAM
jgi:hypothetical protein